MLISELYFELKTFEAMVVIIELIGGIVKKKNTIKGTKITIKVAFKYKVTQFLRYNNKKTVLFLLFFS